MISQILSRLSIGQLNEMQLSAIETGAQDVVLLSPTGSGKTLAFLLALLPYLKEQGVLIQALVIVPGRELALQVEAVFRKMGTGFRAGSYYGGRSLNTELNSLRHPPDVMIGTPGRIAHHLKSRNFDPAGIRVLVLDEFDKSLEYGFEEDMALICTHLPGLQKRILTSATGMTDIPRFTGIRHPEVLDFLEHAGSLPDLKIRSIFSSPEDKADNLIRLLGHIGAGRSVVFVNHREAAERLSDHMLVRNIPHSLYHGGMEQHEREKGLLKFRNGTFHLMVTTDLASRGLDIPELDHVIHYQLPLTQESFIHRNGRTARMKAKGTAYILFTEDERPSWLADYPEEDLPVSCATVTSSQWATLYFNAGKKDKIDRGDIAGFLIRKGDLRKDEVGLIDVFDHRSYAAVPAAKVNPLLRKIAGEKLKSRRIKIELSS